jgi:hypothetical protein
VFGRTARTINDEDTSTWEDTMSEPLPQEPEQEEPQPSDQQDTPDGMVVAELDDDEWQD